jgi:photosynthetic reaction center H subunit
MSSSLTASIDVAQVVLYAFWLFFFGLIFWLRREDRREGYPLESDAAGLLSSVTPVLIPPAKTFALPHGGTVEAPNFERDRRPMLAERTAGGSGFPLQPTGDPILSAVGPASYAQRADTPELTRLGHDLIVPLRDVVAADGKVAGAVKDLWVDRADVTVRYVEVELADTEATPRTRLLPITMLRLLSEPKKVEVVSVRSNHFAQVPTLKDADRVTLLEEERICAFYAGGRLYADPKRIGPVL